MDLHEIVETLEGYSDESPLLMEPRSDYEPCLVGIGYRFKDGPLAVYDINKVLKVLQTRDGMSEEDSEEFHLDFVNLDRVFHLLEIGFKVCI